MFWNNSIFKQLLTMMLVIQYQQNSSGCRQNIYTLNMKHPTSLFHLLSTFCKHDTFHMIHDIWYLLRKLKVIRLQQHHEELWPPQIFYFVFTHFWHFLSTSHNIHHTSHMIPFLEPTGQWSALASWRTNINRFPPFLYFCVVAIFLHISHWTLHKTYFIKC